MQVIGNVIEDGVGNWLRFGNKAVEGAIMQAIKNGPEEDIEN